MKRKARFRGGKFSRSRGEAEREISVLCPDSDHRIEKGIGSHDIPARTMRLNEFGLIQASVQMRFADPEFDPRSFFHDALHAAMFFPPLGVSVLRDSAAKVDRLSDVNELSG